MVPYIIGGVILLIPLVFLGVFLAARMKGKLELTLAKGGFAPGEIITGDLKLTTKKTLEGNRLFVALVGFEEVRRRTTDSDGNSKTETQRNEIYRTELDLEGSGSVPAGTEKSYPFQIDTPSGQATAPDASDSALGKAAGAVVAGLQAFGNTDRKKIWEIQARFDVKGIDLTAKHRVTVSEG